MRFKAVLPVLAMLLCAGFVSAQEKFDKTTDLIQRIDSDRDGFVTQDEWKRFFANSDENRDSILSLEEIGIGVGKNRLPVVDPAVDQLFASKDANKDGVISQSEWPVSARYFRHVDADHDNQISKEEFRSPNARHWNQMFENIDSNRDHLVSRAEWVDTDDGFKKLDRDGNGIINRREFYIRW